MRNEVVLLTGAGASAIAVVRIAGPAVPAFLESHFSKKAMPEKTLHGELRDGQTLIDDPVVVLALDRSFADINLHGGPWVVEATHRLAEKHGFTRIAQALPLPAVAMDAQGEIEREIQAYLPLAATELAVRTLLAQAEAWKPVIASPESVSAQQRERMEGDRALHFLLHPPSVAIVGVPNAGKSTLANQLFAQERSITADLPGTTRDWVGELANIDGLVVRLIDTPGLRDTEDGIEREAIHLSRKVVEASELVLVLLDATQPLDLQAQLLSQFSGALAVVNKIDRNPAWNGPASLRVCATSGEGVDDVRDAIKRRFHCDNPDPRQPRVWTDRQRGWISALSGTIA